MKWLIRVDNNMNSFQIQINRWNTPLDQLGNYLHVVILKWVIFLFGNPTYLSNPSSNADFMKHSWISRQGRPGRENRMDKCPTMGKCLACSRNRKAVTIAGKWGARLRVGANGTSIVMEAFFVLGVLECNWKILHWRHRWGWKVVGNMVLFAFSKDHSHCSLVYR